MNAPDKRLVKFAMVPPPYPEDNPSEKDCVVLRENARYVAAELRREVKNFDDSPLILTLAELADQLDP